MTPDDANNDETRPLVTLTTGSIVAHYKIIQKIGSGGMGDVYLAEDTELKREVALKFLPAHLCQDEDCRTRFTREAQAAAKLNHPNIVTIHEVSEYQGRAFFAMEHVEGLPLKDVIKEKKLSISRVLDLAIQIGKGLSKAHQEGIIHRDVKPSNIVIDSDGHPKLLDFGLAAIQGAEQLTKTGSTLGTVAYMSPEQAHGHSVDHRTDIWSFGVVLYEMLTGKLPFRGERDLAIVHAILNDRAEPPRQLRQGIPPELEKIVLRALEKDVSSRFSSVHELYEDLISCQESCTSTVSQAHRAKSLFRRPSIVIPFLLLVLIAGFVLVQYVQHTRKAGWARQEVLPQVMDLVANEEYSKAFELAVLAKEYIPSDSLLLRQWSEIVTTVTITTSPPGAAVYMKNYGDVNAEWRLVGETPIDSVEIPRGFFRWRVEKRDYQTLMVAASSEDGELDFVLDRTGDILEGMVRVLTSGREPWIGGTNQIEIVKTEDFLIDKFEVTNKQFQAFVDSGGYQRRELWKNEFVKDGKVLLWEEALALLRDVTGRLGPSTWELGRYPEGAKDFPVTGVSWYEAAAFAEFSGKQLPTVHHWAYAASVRASAHIIPLSNFSDSGLATIGSHSGLGYCGAYDMAGNAREWCSNASSGNRYVLGGCWGDPAYMFHFLDKRSAFDRSRANGFRCVKYFKEDATLDAARQDIPSQPVRDYSQERPVSDDVLDAFLSLYDYTRSPLNSEVDFVDDRPDHWTIEKISFDAAYGDERMFGYLFLPVGVASPYQTIILFPGAYAIQMSSSDSGYSMNSWGAVDFIIKSGRAVFYPIYKSTHERGDGFDLYNCSDASLKEHFLMWWKDFARSVDYLETRSDIDIDRLCYCGSSLGSLCAPVFLAQDQRIRTAILKLGGFPTTELEPIYDPLNFAPRVRIPVLMLNGRYDYVFPYETSQIPMFEGLGTPEEHKLHVLFETAHSVHGYQNEYIREALDWLDRYLGPVE